MSFVSGLSICLKSAAAAINMPDMTIAPCGNIHLDPEALQRRGRVGAQALDG